GVGGIENDRGGRGCLAVSEYRKQLLNCKEIESRIPTGWPGDPVLVRVPSKKHFRVFFFMDLLELGRLLLARAIASSIDANFL
ncbi:hypothetical protein GW17_00060577, partial [Ensete ventricosum]